MAAIGDAFLRTQLTERRARLEDAISTAPDSQSLNQLIQEVDSALERMEHGTFGICESCHDGIEKDRLIADPLVRFCLDHLNRAEQRALEDDLQLAARIQRGLLPPTDVRADGWHIHYRYEPAGLVSGDYCDVIHARDGQSTDGQPQNGQNAAQMTGSDGELYFLLGDVSGKGVAASMLMSHLSAMFRSLLATRQPLDRLMALASRSFCESTIAGHYATLVCGQAARNGKIHLAIAGHCPPLLVQKHGVSEIAATGLPIGMFRANEYAVSEHQLAPGESLFLYTDGVSESLDRSGKEYGSARLAKLLYGSRGLTPQALTESCLVDLREFSAGAPKADDLTVMVIHREA